MGTWESIEDAWDLDEVPTDHRADLPSLPPGHKAASTTLMGMGIPEDLVPNSGEEAPTRRIKRDSEWEPDTEPPELHGFDPGSLPTMPVSRPRMEDLPTVPVDPVVTPSPLLSGDAEFQVDDFTGPLRPRQRGREELPTLPPEGHPDYSRGLPTLKSKRPVVDPEAPTGENEFPPGGASVFDEMSTPVGDDDLTPPPVALPIPTAPAQPAAAQPIPTPTHSKARAIQPRRKRPFGFGLALLWGAALAALVAAIVLFLTRL